MWNNVKDFSDLLLASSQSLVKSEFFHRGRIKIRLSHAGRIKSRLLSPRRTLLIHKSGKPLCEADRLSKLKRPSGCALGSCQLRQELCFTERNYTNYILKHILRKVHIAKLHRICSIKEILHNQEQKLVLKCFTYQKL